MRVLLASGIDGFCHRYAALHWAEQLATQGLGATVRAHTDPRLAGELAAHDVMILYRVPHGPWVRHLLDQARKLGRPTLFAVDDLIVDPALAEPPPVRRSDTETRALWQDGVERYRRTLLACDAFLATSEPLVAAGKEAGKTTFLHRCGVSVRELALGEEASRRRPRTGETIRLGYFSGTATHDDDFATIAPVLCDLLARDPRVRLTVGGTVALDPALAAYASRIERVPLVPWPELSARMAATDVNLAPLVWRDPFVAAKGAVKYLEAACVSVPTVASPTDAFRHATRDGTTGVLAADPTAWNAALTRLVADGGERIRLGDAAHADVEERFAPATQGSELRAILEEVRARYARDTPRAGAGATALDSRAGAAARDSHGGAAELNSRGTTELDLARRFPGEVSFAAREANGVPDVACSATTTTPPLGDGVVLTQRFRAGIPGLHRVDVHTVTYGLALDHVLDLRLRRSDGSIAATRTLPAALAPGGDWVALDLAPEPHSAGSLYVLELSARGTGPRNALSFGATDDAGDQGGYTLGAAAHAGALALRTFALPEAVTARRVLRA